jgi:hypothetical protein
MSYISITESGPPWRRRYRYYLSVTAPTGARVTVHHSPTFKTAKDAWRDAFEQSSQFERALSK